MSDIFALAQAWLADHWDAQARKPRVGDIDQWLDQVLEAGWAAPSWPTQWWGRDADAKVSRAIRKMFKSAGAPGAGQDQANIAAVMVMRFGRDSLRAAVLRGLLTGRLRQCLLYSEPNAGSDLSSVQTRVSRRGADHVASGQKIWTSGAQIADYGVLLARSAPGTRRHEGLSLYLLPMRQPGVMVRPIRQITDECRFNEVFLDEAVIPDDHSLGEEGQGWDLLKVALAVERQIMGGGVRERVGEGRPFQAASLLDLMRGSDRLSDLAVRKDIANVLAKRHLCELLQQRARTEAASAAGAFFPSLAKLAMSDVLHSEADLLTHWLGVDSLRGGASSELAAEIHYRAANAFMTSIGGGTDQIQRNIIAERILGLPREPN